MKRFFRDRGKDGYKFVYNTSEIDRNEKTSIQGTNMDLNEVAAKLIPQQKKYFFSYIK